LEKAFSVEIYILIDVISSLNPIVVNLSYFSIDLTNINNREKLNQHIYN